MTPVRRITAWVATTVAGIAAILLVARAWWGPIEVAGVWIRSPLTLETSFALAAGALLFLACLKNTGASMVQAGRNLPLLLLTLVVTAAAFFPDLRDPFISDDYILVGQATLHPAAIGGNFVKPGGDGSYRPLTYAWYGLIHSMEGENPLAWHATILALHLLNCALLFAVARALWNSALVSFTTALLFGIHGTRPEVVAWTSDNSDLLACAFSLAAAWFVFGRWRMHPWLLTGLSLASLTTAILCKESAYAAPVIILAAAAAAERLPDGRIRIFVPGSVLVCVALFAYRWALFKGPGGYVDPATGRPAILGFHPLSGLKALCLRIWAILLFPVNWAEPTGMGVALGLLAGCAAVLFLLRGGKGLRPRLALALVTATALAMIPAIHLALVGDSGLGSRVFYIPAIPFFLLAGHLVAAAKTKKRAVWAVSALAISAMVILEHDLHFWHRAAAEADGYCDAIARGYPPPATNVLTGIVSFRNGLPACVEQKRRRAARPR